MATTLAQRQRAKELLRGLFDQWKDMSDVALLASLRKELYCDVTTQSREDTIKWLVDAYLKRHFL